MDIRTPKKDSVFLYYTLEASGHLCFYFTQDHEKDQQYRDVTIQAPIEMKPLLHAILQDLAREISLTLLSEQEISDQ